MKKALVVDDNRYNLELLGYVLKRHGYEVLTANTGERGVELALAERPSFVLMDIGLPDAATDILRSLLIRSRSWTAFTSS